MIKRRISIVILLSLFIFCGLLVRIFDLQIIQGKKLTLKAVAMRDRQIDLSEYPRGEILDRNLVPLTDIVATNAVYCLPEVINHDSVSSARNDSKALRGAAKFLSGVLPGTSIRQINTALTAAKNIAFIRLKSNLTSAQVAKINTANKSGIIVAPMIKRYSESGFCAHLLGYVSTGGSHEGQAGLEKKYNNILQRSTSSQQLVSVLDARGMVIKGLMLRLKNEQEKNRGTVVLTLDKRVQEIVEEAMNKWVKKGAVVVLNVKNREVVAMASRPTFNPYRVDEIINTDKQSSLINRALSPYYPGSLFKVVTAAAALQEKLVTPQEKFICRGKYVFNNQVSISCWKEGGHGELTFRQALAQSCNCTFITVALRLGREKLLQYVKAFHLTDETLSGYNTGNCGSYVKIDGSDPALGNACLGEQGVMLTPLQMASMLATVADNGRWIQPSLVRYSINQHGQKIYPPGQKSQQAIKPAVARQVRAMLEQVVTNGTGKTAALPEVRVAGKTATSETGEIKENQDQVLNTWFGGYFPAENPEWAIVVLSEDGASGAQDAAPVFKAIVRGILQCYQE